MYLSHIPFTLHTWPISTIITAEKRMRDRKTITFKIFFGINSIKNILNCTYAQLSHKTYAQFSLRMRTILRMCVGRPLF